MLEDIIKERVKKLERLTEAGVNAYPASAQRTHTIAKVRSDFANLETSKKEISIVGRIMGMRDQGKVLFLDLKDETGKFQGVLKADNLKDFELVQSTLDIGDFTTLTGPVFKTQRGEESVDVREFTMLTKTLRPVPSERFGIEEIETRLRKRYLELLVNSEAKELFQKKAIFWDTFRSVLKKEGFLEVETPVLELVPGGAEAEPFVTHHKALDTDFYLRISLELSLKKLLVGGFEKVFEIGRIFRNEGIDKEHLQDYTQLEFYSAYHDYRDLMKLIQKMYKVVIKKTCGTLTTVYDEKTIDWGAPWKKVDYVSVFKKAVGIDPLRATREKLLKKAEEIGLTPEPSAGKGRIIDSLFKKMVRPTLISPCFLINPPVEIEPLAKRYAKDPRRVERFQVVAAGTELGKGFSELNDPADQRARFEEQMKLREAGDTEAQMIDEDFLEALEYGMPPAAGFGISERLFAVLMNKPVRETVIFPLMRKRG